MTAVCHPGNSPSHRADTSAFPACVAGLLYALLLLPPWIPTFLTNAEFRDPSWRFMLHEGFVRKLEFGRDIIFTYGPWGFLTTKMFHPETYSLMLSIWLGMSVLFFALAWRISRAAVRSPWIAMLICAIAIRVVFVESMIFFFSFLVLLLAWRQSNDLSSVSDGLWKRRIDRLLTAGLVSAAGLAPLTKYTYVPATFFMVAVIAAHDLWRKRVPLHSIGILTAMIAAWLLSGQPIGGLLNYLGAGFEVASRYVDAMTNWEVEAFDIAMVWLAAGTIFLLPLCIRIRATGNWVENLILPGIVFTLLFLVFKFTCVGYHAHKLPIYFGSAFLMALFIQLAAGAKPELVSRRHSRATLLTGLMFTFALVAAYMRYVPSQHPVASLALLGNPEHPAAAISVLQGDRWMHAQFERNMQEVRRQHPLPVDGGTVDVVPDKLAIGIANSAVKFNPRPLLHSYATHSPWLAEQNAQHYRSTAAPDHVVFRVNPIVGRFPTLNDGRLWLELLRGYDLQETLPTDLLLCRRSHERILLQRALLQETTAWKTTLDIPRIDSNELIWCEVHIRESATGRLASFAYKLPEVWMDVTTKLGTKRYRFTTASGKSGFLLSPVLDHRQQLAAILKSNCRGRAPLVENISFHTSDWAAEHCYKPQIEVRLEAIAITQQPQLAGVLPQNEASGSESSSKN